MITLKRFSKLYVVTKDSKEYYFITFKNALHFITKQKAPK